MIVTPETGYARLLCNLFQLLSGGFKVNFWLRVSSQNAFAYYYSFRANG
jgi:hypothetical protein